MPGPPPKDPSQRRRRNRPTRGEFTEAEGVGWQHGPVPDPPDGLSSESIEAWSAWFASWIAAHWAPYDVPVLRIVVRLYDEVTRGRFQRSSEFRYWAESYGITPTGRQKLRWSEATADRPAVWTEDGESRYSHLLVVRDPEED